MKHVVSIGGVEFLVCLTDCRILRFVNIACFPIDGLGEVENLKHCLPHGMTPHWLMQESCCATTGMSLAGAVVYDWLSCWS